MPFYEYQCTACGHRLEVLQKISDAPLRDCPQCDAADLKKLISKSAFRLKGGGWYETDFKNAGDGATSEKDADKGDTKSDGKSDTKKPDNSSDKAGDKTTDKTASDNAGDKVKTDTKKSA